MICPRCGYMDEEPVFINPREVGDGTRVSGHVGMVNAFLSEHPDFVAIEHESRFTQQLYWHLVPSDYLL